MTADDSTQGDESMNAKTALTNWEYCFEAGRYTAARSWWRLYWTLTHEVIA